MRNTHNIKQYKEKTYMNSNITNLYLCYNRQNGQACLCSGGVVVQALVTPRVAGVMFTTHPHCGDPTRLLLTANYGLGEVSPLRINLRCILYGSPLIQQCNCLCNLITSFNLDYYLLRNVCLYFCLNILKVI